MSIKRQLLLKYCLISVFDSTFKFVSVAAFSLAIA